MRPDLEELLLEIVALPADQQTSALEALCQRMPADAGFLQRWHHQHRQLEIGLGRDAPQEPSSHSSSTLPLTSIGQYRVIDVIGEGGMGTVYRAERLEPVRMQVAVKVIRRGMSSREVLARFDLERRALAAMNHRCIARIFDAGTTDHGEPYFVMELVEGLTITTYCDRHRMEVSERLVLFQKLCAAVQHAHQKGVVHRDLKPGNVLVVRDGTEHVPKVLDFGLAKATALGDMTTGEPTMAGQALGTPAYMAPEQAYGSTAMIDARADIYALGVMLFQLLTGVLPFPHQAGSGGLAMLQAIANRRSVRPSSELARLPEAAQLAALRMTSPAALLRVLRTDLDWVVLKAMASEPERRYESAAALAMDLQRYCNHEPVLAGPPSTTYRLAKFVRRYRGQVFALTAVFLTAVVGGLFAWDSAIHARQRESEARVSERRAVLANERLGHTLAEEQEARATAEARDYSARIAAAAAALRDGDTVAATRHLELAPPGQRGFEWRYYQARLDNSEETLVGPAGSVRCFAFDPFGRWFASGDQDSRIRVWDATTHRLLATIAQPQWVVSLDASPDGKRLLVTRDGQSVAILEAESGCQLLELPVPGATRAVWQPDGELFAVSSSHNPAVQLWDASTGSLVGQCVGHEAGCTSVAFDSSGQRLLTASMDHTMRVWDIASRKTLALTAPRDGHVVRALFLGDGHQFASICEGVLSVWESASGDLVREVVAHGRVTWGLAVTRDGAAIATSAWDGTVRLWSTATLKQLQLLIGHADVQVCAVAFTPGEDRLLSGARDIKVWRVNEDPPGVAVGVPAWFTCLALRHDGSLLAESGGPAWVPASTEVPRLTLRDTHGREIWKRLLKLGRQPQVLCFDCSGKFVLTGSVDGCVTAFDLLAGTDRTFRAHTTRPGRPSDSAAFSGLAMSPDNRYLASSSRDNVIALWSWPELALVQTTEFAQYTTEQTRISSLTWAPDGCRIVSGHNNGMVLIVDAVRGAVLAELNGHTMAVSCVVCSTDGQLVASGSFDGTVRLWSASDGAELAVLRGHSGYVRSIAFSPDSRRLVSGSDDSTMRLWDVASGREVARLAEHQQSVGSVVFSPDGERIYSKDTSGRIRIWDTERDPGVRELSEELRGLAHRIRLAEERAAELLSTWPLASARLQGWLDLDRTPLITGKPLLAAAIGTIRARGHAGGAADGMPDLFGRATVRALDESRLAAMQRAQAARRGESSVAFEPPPAWQAMNAAQLHAFAWPLVEPTARSCANGREAEAVAALRLAQAKVSAGDTSTDAATVLAAMAWAQFGCGYDQASLDAMAAAVSEASEGARKDTASQRERLIDSVAEAMRRGDSAIAELEARLLAKDDWSFSNADDALQHAALCRLRGRLDAIEAKDLPRIRHRLDVASRSAEAQRNQVLVAKLWEQARNAILRADGVVASRDYAYGGPIELSPQVGLVPLGMNPRTLLWEFYHLDSALDPNTLPRVDPVTGEVLVTEDTGIVFVLVPGHQQDVVDGPAQPSTAGAEQGVLEPFFVARHELTQGQYERLSGGSLPSRLRPGLRYPGAAAPCTRAYPVESISWSETLALLRRHGLDLPTAAQWQVARDTATADPSTTCPARVGSYPANALGLYDIVGNVAEMCLDWHSSNLLPRARGTGLLQVAEVGVSRRVVRGGSFLSARPNGRGEVRSSVAPEEQYSDVGCRAVRALISR